MRKFVIASLVVAGMAAPAFAGGIAADTDTDDDVFVAGPVDSLGGYGAAATLVGAAVVIAILANDDDDDGGSSSSTTN